MSERRFLICEIDQPAVGQIANYEVTESELKRRLDIINGTIGSADRWIDILLHGEGKEEPRIKDQLVRLNGTDNPEPVQPDPWEAWIREMPIAEIRNVVTIGADCDEDLAAWFRKMPRGK